MTQSMLELGGNLKTVATDSPTFITAPAWRGPWGWVHDTSGPADPPGPRPPQLRRANALLREGMIAITKSEPHDVPRAETCFRSALDLLVEIFGTSHPKVSFALDRVGYVCQLQGKEEEAERRYEQSLTPVFNREWPPSPWNEVTLLNVAILYGRLGREAEKNIILDFLRRVYAKDGKVQTVTESPAPVRPERQPRKRAKKKRIREPGVSSHGLRFADVQRAFAEAEQQLATSYQLKGRGHCRRVTLDPRYSRFAVSGATHSWATVRTRSSQWPRRVFALPVVERAAEILRVSARLLIHREC